jgi:hypothetical protein
MPVRPAPLRHVAGVRSPSRHGSGTGACTAKALRRSFVNQRWSISLPWATRCPFGQPPAPGGASPRFVPWTQITCECQRATGPTGVGSGLPRGMLSMTPQHERMPRLVRGHRGVRPVA